jgi:hypothetical protein
VDVELLPYIIILNLEAIPIKVETPPKEDAPEPPSEPMDSIEVQEKQDMAERENAVSGDEDEQRDDEIVVGSKGNGEEHDDAGAGAESSLSSALDSDAEHEVAKSRMLSVFHFCFRLPIYLREDISVEASPPKEITTVGKLGDIEGIRARLDKRLGSDELLKVLHCV